MKHAVAVIFDFDGVLVESVDVKTQAFADMYAEYGPEIVEKVVAYHLMHGGIPRFEKFRYWHRTFLDKEISPEEVQKLGSEFSLIVKETVIKAPWVPGAYDFLAAHHQHLPLFIASGTPDEEMREIVERRNMARYFVAVQGSPASKVEIINTFCIAHGFDRDRVLMVGDSWTDYEGALASGVRFVGRISDAAVNFPSNVPVIIDLKELHKYC
jgi:HAD superfamily hydrolase (TIGR01549 family)